MQKFVIRFTVFFIVLFLAGYTLFDSVSAILAPGKTSLKKGVGYTGGTVEQLNALGVSWGYRWYTEPADFSISGSYEYIPMVWGANYNQANIVNTARSHPGSFWLIFNEPNRSDQANLTASNAANLYWNIRQQILGVDPTAKLIVGGVYNIDTTWLTDFRNAYKNLSQNTAHSYPLVDGWHVHYYIGMADTYLSDRWRDAVLGMKRWMERNGEVKPVWLTEFGCLNCWTAAGEQKMKQIMLDQIPWLENQTWIARYAWFATKTSPNMSGDLLTDSGLTSLGQLYATFGTQPNFCPRNNLGNLNCSAGGEVDMVDLTLLLNAWGTAGTAPVGQSSADLIFDGTVNMSDLTLLINNWGR